ncbi:helix-turn-helix domain-containing protein [Nocardia sp. BMG111209]|uniref:helix-turn-helix domain-containing protein n=1 Tax=Nocardia sp. BMG111209 TaxID=1160137 RepID=UPI000569D9A1|nr:helix-turn-helix transcriptional regulator [Nocardia sp. BMG111209]
MDSRSEVGQFLRTRRARVTPRAAGLETGAGHRRVPGLRREEVALLAGISVDYYARMERGNLTGVSDDVLDAVSRALQLDVAETRHLHDLTRAGRLRPQPTRRSGPGSTDKVPPALQRFLDAITGTPVWVRNQRMDFIAANPLGRALLSPLLEDPSNRNNNARFMFLNPAARTYYPEWARGADDIVATLRATAGRNPLDKALTDLIGELVTRSDDFRYRWSAHNVRFHRTGIKRIHHPDVGDLEFAYQAMELADTPGWTLFAATTEPGSPTEERIHLLGSLAATRHSENAAPD